MPSRPSPPFDIPPLMDPHPRVPTPDPTSPGQELPLQTSPSTDAEVALDVVAQTELNGDAEDLDIVDFDDLAVDEMVRDLELDNAVDTLDITPDLPECNGASEDDFALVGVRNLEWRLGVIRTAANRSAGTIASAQLVEPSTEKEQRLSEIVLSTYRLIDPRFRGSYFQQVRVGRLMPMLLQVAACIDFSSPAIQHKIRHKKNGHRYVRLFGHAIPVTATPPPTQTEHPHRQRLRIKKKKRINTTRVEAPSLNYRDEALEVFAELQSNSYRTFWHESVHDARVLSALIAVTAATAVGLGLFVVRHRLISPREVATTVDHDPASELTATRIESSDGGFDQVPLITPSPSEFAIDPAAEIGLLMPPPDVLPVELASIQMTTDELFAALAKVVDVAETTELPAPRILPEEQVPIETTQSSEMPPPAVQPDQPAPTAPIESSDHDPLALAEAVSALWSETESAARRFTGETVAELIDTWDLIAELAGPESIENAAAKHLINEASWLASPLPEIVAQIRQTDPATSARFVIAADSESRNTANLTEDEITQLLGSWQAARKRVVHTVDLDRMQHQANVLLDRIVISDQLSPTKRIDFLAAFRIDVEQLAKISKDKETLTETTELLADMDSLPAAAAWKRLEAAEKPSGLLASVYCLQQRRWETGLNYLVQTSNLAVASAAQAERKLLEPASPDNNTDEQPTEISKPVDAVTARAALADRWSKIADRLEGREAATIRLHAIDLYGDAPQYASQRLKLREQLPAYFELAPQ